MVFVDDSTDDTPGVIVRAAQDCPFPVTVLHRERPTGGLGGAVVEGLRAATSDWIVVMDGDLQHPPSLVPELVGSGERSGAASSSPAVTSRAAAARDSRRLPHRRLTRRDLADQDPLPAPTARHQRPDERLLRDPPQRGHRRHPPAPRLQDPPRTRRTQPPPSGHRGALRLPGPVRRESKSSAREGFRFLRHLAGLRTASPVARMVVFGLIGATGFLPNLLGLYMLTAVGLHYLPAEILANQFGVAWNFLLIEHLLFRERRRHRNRWDRMGRFALLANADLVLRIPLIALFVRHFGMGALSATALALVTTFVLRFAGTEALVYLPRRSRAAEADGGSRGRGHTTRGDV
ncbi:glycosyltransferase [Streptomyces kaempferi]